MSIKSSLRDIVTATGGTSDAKSIKGILREISESIGGSTSGVSISDMLTNIADAVEAREEVKEEVIDQ